VAGGSSSKSKSSKDVTVLRGRNSSKRTENCDWHNCSVRPHRQLVILETLVAFKRDIYPFECCLPKLLFLSFDLQLKDCTFQGSIYLQGVRFFIDPKLLFCALGNNLRIFILSFSNI
jgi:hypothetical protein